MNSFAGMSLASWQLAVVLAVLLLGAPVLGSWFGATQRAKTLARGSEPDLSVGEVSLGATMALLGLILAFTFGNALSTFAERTGVLVEEANAIGTAFLRTDYLPEEEGLALKEALYDYALTRVLPTDGSLATGEGIQEWFGATFVALDRLWPVTVEATSVEGIPDPIRTFVAGSVNEVIDMHSFRIETYVNPLRPVTNWMTIGFTMAALFLLGNRTGLSGKALTWRPFVFSAILWCVLYSIYDVQHSSVGTLTTPQGIMISTIIDMRTTLESLGAL